MHKACRMEFRFRELERTVETQGIVINRLKRHIEGAWSGAA